MTTQECRHWRSATHGDPPEEVEVSCEEVNWEMWRLWRLTGRPMYVEEQNMLRVLRAGLAKRIMLHDDEHEMWARWTMDPIDALAHAVRAEESRPGMTRVKM